MKTPENYHQFKLLMITSSRISPTDQDWILAFVENQQAETHNELAEALEHYAPEDMIPEITPSLELIERMGKRLKAQQAVIDAARAVRRIPAHQDGPGNDMALESLFDALDALDKAGQGKRAGDGQG